MQGFAPLFRMITGRIEAFLADRGYDADAIREEIEAAGVEAVIPAKINRRNPAPHDRTKYKWRNLVERLFNTLKNWRRVATRYDKTKESYLGFVALASVKLWIPFVHKVQVTDSLCRNQILIEASWMEARKLSSRLSYRVAMARKCLSLLKKRSTRLR